MTKQCQVLGFLPCYTSCGAEKVLSMVLDLPKQESQNSLCRKETECSRSKNIHECKVRSSKGW